MPPKSQPIDGPSSPDEYFAYADFDNPPSSLAAVNQLETYVAAEGPFDGVLAFSQGATIAVTYLANVGKAGRPLPFKCAIFLSAEGVLDVDLLADGQMKVLASENIAGLITIPTAHIWGLGGDSSVRPAAVHAVCAPGRSEVFVHEGGQEIPGVASPTGVKGCVRAMRRVISLAEH